MTKDSRADLLDAVIEHVSRHGMSHLSLRELATAVGSSHRMLIYHFGGRDGLVAAVVAEVEQRQRQALVALAEHATSPAALIRAQWAQLCDPALRPMVALFFEVLALAVHERPGTAGFLDGLTDPWIAAADEVAHELGSRNDVVDLRLGIAVTRGLLVDVLASGDLVGPTAALERFLERWDAVDPSR